jgi:hypothetical protein
MGWSHRTIPTWSTVTKPTGFVWDAPITVETDGQRHFRTDFDVSDFEYVGSGKTYYVDPVNGSDSNDGLTEGSPLKSVNTAALKVDVDIILAKSGIVVRSECPGTVTRSMTIKAMPGADVIFSGHDVLTWTKTAGLTNVYQASKSSIATVFDASNLDANGDYSPVTRLLTSAAEVDATPNSYYKVGATIYCHPFDSRIPDSDIRVYIDAFTFLHAGDSTYYFEGIKFEGGKWSIGNTAVLLTPKVYAKDCTFSYMMFRDGGLEIQGAEFVYLQNCVGARSENDGFNYHILNETKPKVLEVNCVYRMNGGAGDIDNGSTMHDGGSIVRVNCVSHGNKGPNIADVGVGTQSWNMGCFAMDSTATTSAQNSDFTVDAGEMWLDGCYASGSDLSLDVRSGATMYVRNVRAEGPESVVGTKVAY